VIGQAIRVSMPLVELVTIVGFAFVIGFFAGVWVRR
jgi:hypothetical protein